MLIGTFFDKISDTVCANLKGCAKLKYTKIMQGMTWRASGDIPDSSTTLLYTDDIQAQFFRERASCLLPPSPAAACCPEQSARSPCWPTTVVAGPAAAGGRGCC